MAVIQISKIQVRRGLEENLPQLASGELGWSIDTQKLYIGNGTLSEGAPQIGNTEIITAGRDILSAIQSYIFKGDESGYTSQTGASALSPVKRSLQHKFDENISVKDFGAVGNGITDDTAAIQRAIDQVYPSSYFNTPGTKRKLKIPAGVYITSATLNVPPYASISGDGPYNSIIKKTSGADGVLTLKDSRDQTGAGMNPSTSTLPFFIDIHDLTLQTTSTSDVVVVDSARNILFDRVRFVGNVTSPTSVGTGNACIRLTTTVANVAQIHIQNSSSIYNHYGIYASGNIQQVVMDNTYMSYHYRGIVSSSNGFNVPQGLRLKNNLFDHIADSAVYSTGSGSMVSAFNYYRDVGTNLVGTGSTPQAPVIYYEGPNNYSFGDLFDRSEADAAVKLRIQTVANNSSTVTTLTSLGTLKNTPGTLLTLANSVSSSTNTGLALHTIITNAIIDYSVTRNSVSRIGVIKFTQTSGTITYDDEYSETGNTGVLFNWVNSGSYNYLQYVSSTDTFTANLNYQIRRFTSV